MTQGMIQLYVRISIPVYVNSMYLNDGTFSCIILGAEENQYRPACGCQFVNCELSCTSLVDIVNCANETYNHHWKEKAIKDKHIVLLSETF